MGRPIPRRSALLISAGLSVALAELSFRRRVKSDETSTSLQDAVDACEPGDQLVVSKSWTIGAPVHVDKPLEISSKKGGRVSTSGDHHAFVVTADNVWFRGLDIVGGGAHSAGTQAAIHVLGTRGRPLIGLRIEECSIIGFLKYGVEAWHVHNFSIGNNALENIAYGAIMILSGRDGVIDGNSIRNVVQPEGFANSYGIALTHDTAASSFGASRSQQIEVRDNLINGVTRWEGIDTHGGVGILIEGNEVLNCRVGIALVPGGVSDAPAFAPEDFRVLRNTVKSTVVDGSRLHGIQVAGVLADEADLGRVHQYATGTVDANTVIGHGSASISNTGGIFLRTTAGVEVKGNRLIEPNPAGILCYHTNKNLRLENNECVDAWTDTHLQASMIRIVSSFQSLYIDGNDVLRGDRVAARVNVAGVSGAPGQEGVEVEIAEGNDFSRALIPVAMSKALD